jgi:hypothetical protein
MRLVFELEGRLAGFFVYSGECLKSLHFFSQPLTTQFLFTSVNKHKRIINSLISSLLPRHLLNSLVVRTFSTVPLFALRTILIKDSPSGLVYLKEPHIDELFNMDYERDVLLWYLGTVADNARYPPDLRDKATHIIVSFMRHRNAYRLLAQATELARGELVMYPFQQVGNIPRNIGLPVRRFGQNIRAITTAFGIIPTNADYEGHPIELISILDPAVEANMNDNQRLEFHRALLVKERQANADLARAVQRYGYHYIFRAGLQQYYMTYVFLHIFI